VFYNKLFDCGKQGDWQGMQQLHQGHFQFKDTPLISLLNDVYDYQCQTGWDYIVFFNQQKILDALYQHITSRPNYTPLGWAVVFNQKETIQALLNGGTDINAQVQGEGYQGRTPLFIAAEDGYLDTVKYLCRRGASINQRLTSNGATPLCIAAWLLRNS
jgi:ankyrin repeat protein